MTPIEAIQQQQQPTHPSTPFPIPPTQTTTDDLTLLYEKLAMECEQFVQLIGGQAQYAHMNVNLIPIRECLMHLCRSRELTPPQALVQKVSFDPSFSSVFSRL